MWSAQAFELYNNEKTINLKYYLDFNDGTKLLYLSRFTRNQNSIELFDKFQKVYCGHEYSIQNLTFGNHVEPNNEVIKAKLTWCQSKRSETPAKPTVPSTIGKHKNFD